MPQSEATQIAGAIKHCKNVGSRALHVLLIPQFCPHRPRMGLLCKTGQPLV